LTLRQQVSSILRECIDVPPPTADEDEFIRFARQNLFIRTTDAKLVPLVLRPVQLEFHRDLTGRDNVSKSRKHGISTYIAARFYWKLTTGKNLSAALVAHDPAGTASLWQIVQLFYDNDPRVKSGELTTRYASTIELYFDQLNSRFRAINASEGSGRASTTNLLHISELAFWKGRALNTLIGMLESVPPRERGSEVFIESTSNGEGNDYHQRFVAAVQGESSFAAHFFPWFEHPENVAPWEAGAPDYDDEERLIAARFRLSPEQIAFRRVKIRDLGRDKFRQEHPLTWQESFLASGRPALDRDALEALEHLCARAPLNETREDQNYARVFAAPKPGGRYAAGIDMSEGVRGGDAQDLSIIDAVTLEEVASMNGRWPIHVFARKSAAMVNAYQAFTAVEVNNHGHALLEHWLHGKDALRVDRELLYHRKDYDNRGRAIKKPGWLTNEKTRPIMVADFDEAVRKRWVSFHDREFYTEARAFAYQDDGKPAAPPGMHDDRVISRALALQARKEALTTGGFRGGPIHVGL